jgi:hypothetical protein
MADTLLHLGPDDEGYCQWLRRDLRDYAADLLLAPAA